eukprot:SM000187S03898  [mRNA]  locus=s187:252548:254897:- [translate_table: standard]
MMAPHLQRHLRGPARLATLSSTRAALPASTVVTLVLQNDLALDSTLIFNASFSCSIVQSAAGAPQGWYTIALGTDTAPVLDINGASNVMFDGVSFRLPVTDDSPRNACKYTKVVCNAAGLTYCPAINIRRTFGVQLVRGAVFGRIDISFTYQTTIDSMVLSTTPADPGVVRIGDGCGNTTRLSIGYNVVSNNDISGGQTGVMLAGGSSGATVANNYCHGLGWTCVQIGQGIHNVGDAVNHHVLRNFIESGTVASKKTDAAGIYIDLHWFGPGNYLSCNYVIGGEHCIYLDYATSGVTVEGQVCVGNMNGVKQNNGKGNSVTGVLAVGLQSTAAWISCQLTTLNNCGNDPGEYWARQGNSKYGGNPSPRLAGYEWYADICSEEDVDGVPCHAPPGTDGQMGPDDTAKCSGVPTRNTMQVAIVQSQSSNVPRFTECQSLAMVPQLNNLTYSAYSGLDAVSLASDLGLADPANGDYGLLLGSPILQDLPDFTSCPRSSVGPQPANEAQYWSNFNVYSVSP